MDCQMRVIFYKEVEAKKVEEGSKLKIRWLNTEGSKNFAVRHFEIEPGGYSPHHSHPWEHEIFVLEGTGTVIGNEVVEAISVGNIISIPGEETHQIKNTGKSTLKFLCIIPK
jgi:quercetin dioxygenase-like cupin family protein